MFTNQFDERDDNLEDINNTKLVKQKEAEFVFYNVYYLEGAV